MHDIYRCLFRPLCLLAITLIFLWAIPATRVSANESEVINNSDRTIYIVNDGSIVPLDKGQTHYKADGIWARCETDDPGCKYYDEDQGYYRRVYKFGDGSKLEVYEESTNGDTLIVSGRANTHKTGHTFGWLDDIYNQTKETKFRWPFQDIPGCVSSFYTIWWATIGDNGTCRLVDGAPENRGQDFIKSATYKIKTCTSRSWRSYLAGTFKNANNLKTCPTYIDGHEPQSISVQIPDPCPHGDGNYCGGIFELHPDRLYSCQDSEVIELEICAHYCHKNDPDVDDVCGTVSTPGNSVSVPRIWVFDHPNFEGNDCGALEYGEYEVCHDNRNEVSSVQIDAGSVMLYKEGSTNGPTLCLTDSDLNLADNVFSDNSSADNSVNSYSFHEDEYCGDENFVPNAAKFFEHSNYAGAECVIEGHQGWFNLNQKCGQSYNDIASSVQIASGVSVYLFEDANNYGAYKCIDSNKSNFNDVALSNNTVADNKITSVYILHNGNCDTSTAIDFPPLGVTTPNQSSFGLWYNEAYVPHSAPSVPNIADYRPSSFGPVSNINLDIRTRDDDFALQFQGCIDIPETDNYTFYLNSDDGSKLYIDDQLVVNNDGLHGEIELSNSLQKQAGQYKFLLKYYESGGDQALGLKVSSPSMSKQNVPNAWFTHGHECSGIDTNPEPTPTPTPSPTPTPPSGIPGWQYNQKLTIDHTKVQGNLVDFPVLITGDVFESTTNTSTTSGELSSSSLNNDSNLQGYYKFESSGITSDSSGKGNNLTTNGSITSTSGKFNNSASMAGTGQYLSSANASWNNPAGAFSIGGWFYLNTAGETGLISKGLHANSTLQYGLRLNGSSVPTFYGDNDGSWGPAYQAQATTSLSTGQWHHVVGIFDGSTYKIYVNGVLEGSVAGSAPTARSGNFYIGSFFDTSSYTLDGLSDDVFLFNRALSISEVTKLSVGETISTTTSHFFSNVQSGELSKGKLANDAGLITYYKFDQNALTTDSKSSNNLSVSGNASSTVGKFGSAVSFTGTSHMYAPNSTTTNPTGAFSIGGWFYLNSAGETGLISKGLNSNSSIQYGLRLNGSSIPTFYGDDNGSWGPAYQAQATTPLSVGQWHHVVGVFDGSTYKIYVNGVLEGSVTGSAPTARSGNFYVGSYFDTTTYTLDGKTDDVFLFNRALSENEIANTHKGGADIRFSSDANGQQELPFEVVSIDSSTLKTEIWVKLPSLSNTTDTDLYIWYGNPNADPYPNNHSYGSHNVWSSNYQTVYHMGNLKDSTSNSFGLVGNTTPTLKADGKFSSAYKWNGTTDNLKVIFPTASTFNSGWTFSTWVKPQTLGEGSDTDYSRIFDIDGKTFMRLSDDNGTSTKIRFTQVYTGPDGGWVTNDNPLVKNTWNHVVVVFNGSTAGTAPLIYINGVQKNLTNYAIPSGTIETSNVFNIGNNNNNGVRTFDGYEDEIKVSNALRSAEWISTEYNNQSDPGIFFK